MCQANDEHVRDDGFAVTSTFLYDAKDTILRGFDFKRYKVRKELLKLLHLKFSSEMNLNSAKYCPNLSRSITEFQNLINVIEIRNVYKRK